MYRYLFHFKPLALTNTVLIKVKTKSWSGNDVPSFAVAISYIEGTPLLQRCQELGSWKTSEIQNAEWPPLVRQVQLPLSLFSFPTSQWLMTGQRPLPSRT